MGWILRLSLPASAAAAAETADTADTSGTGLAAPPPVPWTAADTAEIASLLWDAGTTGVAERSRDDGRVEVLAGFAAATEAEAAAALLLARRPAQAGSGQLLDIEPADASWATAEPTATVDLGPATVTIEVGPAFGHGRHPTTRLALELLTAAVEPGQRVLDLGTGSGILALAALAQGAGHVLAVDNDPTALAVARANLERHRGLGAGVVELADELPAADAAAGRFDLVVANLVLSTQLELAAGCRSLLGPSGRLLVSGILHDQATPLVAAHRSLSIVERRTDGDWVALALAPSP